MPVGKYYCDYCEKEFQDTPAARKRHLQSKPHLRSKSLWFLSLSSDPNPHFSDALPKGFCNRFLSTGFCPFGDSCKYLHPKSIPGNTSTAGFTGNAQTLNGLCNQQIGGSSSNGELTRERLGTGWGDLPPSLKPPPEGGYPQLPFVDWG